MYKKMKKLDFYKIFFKNILMINYYLVQNETRRN